MSQVLGTNYTSNSVHHPLLASVASTQTSVSQTSDCNDCHSATAPISNHYHTSQLATTQECVNSSSQKLFLMNIPTEDLNFSEIEQVWLVKSWQEILFRVTFVAPIVLLGLVGNLTIIYSMCHFKQIRSKPTNIFILNMALADLLTTIVCPNAALLTDIYQFYILGSFICRFEGFIKITCLLVSAYSLIVLSFDWFLCVVKPCRQRITIKQAWLTLVSIWLISIAMASPLFYWRRLRERHWKDLVEVWCCELIQYTKFYWLGITLFLIYLPTLIMSIVLVVILAQMDRFEAKLKRSRRDAQCVVRSSFSSPTFSRSTNTNFSAPTISNSCSMSSLNIHNMNDLSAPSASGGGGSSALTARENNSLSISLKYRRRIVKILFFYSLTSMICWTPLQFTIIYRHFRSEAVPARWFFELAFFSQLCASLSAVMNPIIFGFLSQPFRRIVTKSWMFRFLDKVRISRNKSNDNNANNLPLANRQPPNIKLTQQRQFQHNHKLQNEIYNTRVGKHHKKPEKNNVKQVSFDEICTPLQASLVKTRNKEHVAAASLETLTSGHDNKAYLDDFGRDNFVIDDITQQHITTDKVAQKKMRGQNSFAAKSRHSSLGHINTTSFISQPSNVDVDEKS